MLMEKQPSSNMPTLYKTARRKQNTLLVPKYKHPSTTSRQSSTIISGSCAPTALLLLLLLLLPPPPLQTALLFLVDFALPKGTADAAVAAGVLLRADDVAPAAFLPTACFFFGRVTSLTSVGDAWTPFMRSAGNFASISSPESISSPCPIGVRA